MDEQLLKKAQAEKLRFEEAERETRLIRSDYHAAVRRLHLSGGSLRDVAKALGLSHQRVQQIVDGSGGSWWQRVWKSRKLDPDVICTFCQRPPSEVAKMIAGPNVRICDRCVAAAERAANDEGADGPFGLSNATLARCAFCGKRKSGKRRLVTGSAVTVCVDCLEQCRHILKDRAA